MAKRYKRILEKKTLSKPGSTQQTNLKNIQLLLLPLEYGTTTQNSTEKKTIYTLKTRLMQVSGRLATSQTPA